MWGDMLRAQPVGILTIAKNIFVWSRGRNRLKRRRNEDDEQGMD